MNSEEREARQAGQAAFVAGKPRVIDRDWWQARDWNFVLGREWYKGWDRANLTAPMAELLDSSPESK